MEGYFDGSTINIFVAFTGGLISFFASCLLPLVPTYLAYLAGGDTSSNKKTFLSSVYFTIGFITVFVILGALANVLNSYLYIHRFYINTLGGLFFISMGLFMAGFIKPSFLNKDRHINLNLHSKFYGTNAFITGVFFGLAWTPCIGPVLGVILFWASQSTTILNGVLLLLFYGLGLGIPFMVIGALSQKILPKLKGKSRYGAIINRIAGLVIIFFGILMLFDKVSYLSLVVVELFGIDAFSI